MLIVAQLFRILCNLIHGHVQKSPPQVPNMNQNPDKLSQEFYATSNMIMFIKVRHRSLTWTRIQSNTPTAFLWKVLSRHPLFCDLTFTFTFFDTKLYAFHASPMHATWSTSFILLDLTMLIVSGERQNHEVPRYAFHSKRTPLQE
jgi:hypothetical protein